MLPPHSEPATWPGYTSTSPRSAASCLERMEEILGALARGDREVGSCRVADEERVAGQHERVVDDERAVLGPVARACAGRVIDTAPTCDPLAVGERLVRELGLGERVDRDRHAVLEREPAVTRDVVGVRVRLEHPLDPDALGLRPPPGTARSRTAGSTTTATPAVRVTDEVGGAAEILVHELPEEQHEW